MPSISRYVNNFEAYAQKIGGRRLTQGMWLQGGMACALGAFFQVKGVSEAWLKAKDAGINNANWLIASTPKIFDFLEKENAIEWAQAIYGEGGIIHRSEKLGQHDRDLLFEEARIEVIKRLVCNGHPADLLGAFAQKMGHPREQKRIAATAVQVLDELLTKKELRAVLENSK